MRTTLQNLRDAAERQSRIAAEQNDRDSADAWERIGLAIDDCQQRIKYDLRVIESRLGLMTPPGLAMLNTAESYVANPALSALQLVLLDKALGRLDRALEEGANECPT
jgi:hypothetical protein